MLTDCTGSEFTKRWISNQWDNVKGVKLGSIIFPGVKCEEVRCEDILRYIECGVRYVALSTDRLWRNTLTVVDEFLNKNPGEFMIVDLTNGDDSTREIWRTVNQTIGHRLSLLSTGTHHLTMEVILAKHSLLLVTDIDTIPDQFNGYILQYSRLKSMSTLKSKTGNETFDSINVWSTSDLDPNAFNVMYVWIFGIIVFGIASRFQRRKFSLLALTFLAIIIGGLFCIQSSMKGHSTLPIELPASTCINPNDLEHIGNVITNQPGIKFTTGKIQPSVSLALAINTQRFCQQDEVMIINDSSSKCPKHLKPRPVVYVIASRDEGTVITWNEIPDGGHVIVNQKQYPMDSLLLVYAGASHGHGWKMLWSEFLHPVVEKHPRCIVRAVEDENGTGFACVAEKINADCCGVGDRHNRISAIEWKK